MYLDLKAKSWHEVPRVPSVPEPPGRQSHACFVYKGKMWVADFPTKKYAMIQVHFRWVQ